MVHCFYWGVTNYTFQNAFFFGEDWLCLSNQCRLGRESWLLCLICLPGVSWWLSGSSSRCHGVVCGLWLWYFLIILTYYFCVNVHCLYKRSHLGGSSIQRVKHLCIYFSISETNKYNYTPMEMIVHQLWLRTLKWIWPQKTFELKIKVSVY